MLDTQSQPAAVPVEIADPVNGRILAISEDRLAGFFRDPFAELAERCGLSGPVVLERLRGMLKAGTIRRIRQTLLANNLAPGALVAWKVGAERLDEAFDFMSRQDPFSGHVVVRSTDADTPGAAYRLWTTLKVPSGYSMRKHCEYLLGRVGGDGFRMMPAKCLFALGVGHVRRKAIGPGSRAPQPGEVIDTALVELSALEWRVLESLKREFAVEEVSADPWRSRAVEAGVSLDEFCEVALQLAARGVIGRFSTFLEHVKPSVGGTRVTRYNALFHWRVPTGREIEAGREVGRHHIVTHAYWRDGGPEFGDVNIMAVVHGTDKATVLAHKAAIDEHLREAGGGLEVTYTNVFWGGRSEIKPSEVSPTAYASWCLRAGVDPAAMRD